MSASVSPLVFSLENPFGGKVHPQAERLRAYGRDWVQRVGLVQTEADLSRFEAARYWQLVAATYPHAPWDILTIIHDWSCWGFFLDDYDDTGAATAQPAALRRFFDHLLAVLQDTPLPCDLPPLLRVLADIWERMARHSARAWQQRFASALADSFSAYEWEARNRADQRVPSVGEYLPYRRKTSGWRTLALLVDLSMGHTLPERIYTSDEFQAPLDAANNVICWANDIFSFEKECASGDVHNLVHIVQTEQRCTTEAAIQTIVGWHNQEIQRWQQLVDHLPRQWGWWPPDARLVQAYMQFSQHSMYANHVWSQASGRYQMPIPG
ncbi:MAG TPA: terpene synthase family protein [Ktedonobacterales bacterium]|nr:terpene synthase family protein [Ktedonobacterales bacterium]